MSHRSSNRSERVLTLIFSVTNTELTQTAIRQPVLYVVLYDTSEVTSEIDDYHWAFIVGPSYEEADSKGTLFSMEPRDTGRYDPDGASIWRWLYNQPTIPLRGQANLLARLMIAEVADMVMLQAVILRWGPHVDMRANLEWMSVNWVKNILNSLDEEESCLGRRMESFESVEFEVCTFRSKRYRSYDSFR